MILIAESARKDMSSHIFSKRGQQQEEERVTGWRMDKERKNGRKSIEAGRTNNRMQVETKSPNPALADFLARRPPSSFPKSVYLRVLQSLRYKVKAKAKGRTSSRIVAHGSQSGNEDGPQERVEVQL